MRAMVRMKAAAFAVLTILTVGPAFGFQVYQSSLLRPVGRSGAVAPLARRAGGDTAACKRPAVGTTWGSSDGEENTNKILSLATLFRGLFAAGLMQQVSQLSPSSQLSHER